MESPQNRLPSEYFAPLLPVKIVVILLLMKVLAKIPSDIFFLFPAIIVSFVHQKNDFFQRSFPAVRCFFHTSALLLHPSLIRLLIHYSGCRTMLAHDNACRQSWFHLNQK